jgi:hypothetical protein
MRQVVIPFGWHSRNLPTGEYASLVPNQHVSTHLGPIEFLDNVSQPLFIDITMKPSGFKVAGQCWPDEGASKDKALEWSGQWRVDSRTGVGVSPILYDQRDGTLLVSNGSVGSQGYRSWDSIANRPVSGDATYAPANGHELNEWTKLPCGLVVGQRGSTADEMQVWDGRAYRRVPRLATPTAVEQPSLLNCRFIHGIEGQVGGETVVALSTYRLNAGENSVVEAVLTWATEAELRALPVWTPPPPPVEKPIGPLSAPLPEGTWIDVAPFFGYDAAFWPRGDKARGDTHGMDMQIVQHKGKECIWFAKFDEVGKGRLGELLTIDADPNGYIHLLADCSNETLIDTWSDSRWLRKRMQIGRPYGVVDNGSKLRKLKRSDGSLVSEQDWTEENWIIAVWPKFWCGSDLGECAVLRYAYNASGFRDGQGTGDPDRWVETYYMATKDGRPVAWGDWTTDPSSVVFATTRAVFPSPPTVRSRFFYLGGRRYAPDFPSFIPLATSPIEVPVSQPIPPNVFATIRRFAAAYPIPQGEPGDEHENRCRVWTRSVCEQVRTEHGPQWGHKRASTTRPPSKETIARKVGAALDGWDLLQGAGTGAPTLSGNPEWHDLVAEGNQVFIEVSAIDRLGRGTLRPPLRGIWRGLSSFDLGARLALGDRRWLDNYAVGFSPLRVMVSRQSGPTPRTLADGRVQLTRTLTALVGEQQAHVVLLADTLNYTLEDMMAHVFVCNEILVEQASKVASVELANEIGHPTQSPHLMDIDFLEILAGLVDVRFPLAWGGEFWGGSFITHHSDRGTSPAGNGVIMQDMENVSRKAVIDDEPLGIAESDRVAGQQRTDNPDFARQIARVSLDRGLGGVTLHTDAGLTCNMDEVGPVHREARRVFLAEFGPVAPPPPPPPPVPPPATGHPILDAPLSPAYPTGYAFFIANGDAILAEAQAWYVRYAGGRVPARTDIFHGLWRGLNEGERWRTLRAAWQDTWPGGEPR